ncbi:CCA tRNA nucleotidyltransferase [Planococcus ruber]|uniref:CCA tRNA nucleotidyltransferase n=1 Tax=Planococcus ruber TaxID=2027871 RepID=UPI001FED832F|nr:CCA tRNA nucleotidyltransferase [Planococcus ruber]MCJ1907384.1 CCA tRNA nucleotidyltransferase [Planococcus ruber]
MKTAIKVIEQLEGAGFEAYMVGGAVRDYLLEKKPHDIDVATNASPEQVKSLFERTVDTGIAHGTVLVLKDGSGIEVTTYRTEGSYSDHRRPDSVEFVQSLEEDLKRRDFTINAMAMDKDMAITDPFGGAQDLAKGLIRAVGNPDERFQEDALRMLRAIRFSGQLDFQIDPSTLASIGHQAHLIKSIAIERIKSEIDKMMLHKKASRSFAYLTDTGLAEHLPSGYLFKADWAKFQVFETAAAGWAFMLFEHAQEIEAILPYRFSNEEKQTIKRALEAARLPEWNEWVFYSYTNAQLAIAALLNGRKVEIAGKKSALPIRSKAEMAVNGSDLMKWSSQKQGPWIKEWIAKIERMIVFGELANDRELIKEWFMHEYRHHQ